MLLCFLRCGARKIPPGDYDRDNDDIIITMSYYDYVAIYEDANDDNYDFNDDDAVINDDYGASVEFPRSEVRSRAGIRSS